MSYSTGSIQAMSKHTTRVCSGCGIEFGDDVDMFEPVAADKAKQAARKLMDNPPDELLCPECFAEHLKSLDKKVLATVIAGMAKKIKELTIKTYPQIGITDYPIKTYPATSVTYPAITPQTINIPPQVAKDWEDTLPKIWCGDKPTNSGTVTF